jgi:hypothetical protein
MSRAVYSTVIASVPSIGDTPTPIGAPPAGSLWVCRFAAATFGSYAAYVNAALSLAGEDPWLWLMTSQVGNYFSDHPVTFYWEGRLVVPAGVELYAKASDGDYFDLHISGYVLTVDAY